MPSICFLIFILISIAPWDLGPNFSEGQLQFLRLPLWTPTSAKQAFLLPGSAAGASGLGRAGAGCLGRSRSAHCHAEAWLAHAGLSVLLKGSELREARVVSASTFSPAAGDPRPRQRLV